MATSTLVRDDVISIDGTPVRRLLVYRISLDPVGGAVDLLLTSADFDIISVVPTAVVAFRTSATYVLSDANDGMVACTVLVRPGFTGPCPVEVPDNPAALTGPSRLRLALARGTPSVGLLQFDIGISGPLSAADPGAGIVPLPPPGPAPTPGPTPAPTPAPQSLADQVAALTSGLASLRDALLTKADAYSVGVQLAGIIGDAPASAQTLGELYDQLVQLQGATALSRQIFQFPVPSLRWVVAHNRGTRNYTLTIMDATGRTTVAASSATDANTICIYYTEPVSGAALIEFW